MNSITRLAFAAAMLGAATLWMAGRPVVTDRGGPSNPGVAPLHYTQVTRAADVPGDGASETTAREEQDDSSPRRSAPVRSPLSVDALD